MPLSLYSVIIAFSGTTAVLLTRGLPRTTIFFSLSKPNFLYIRLTPSDIRRSCLKVTAYSSSPTSNCAIAVTISLDAIPIRL